MKLYWYRFVLLFYFLFLTQKVFNQDNYLKLIEDGDFSAAENLISPIIKKKPNDVLLNYAMALIYMNRSFDGANIERAYDYIRNAKYEYLITTDIKVLQNLYKIPLNLRKINNIHDSICKLAFEEVMQSAKVENFEKYIVKFESSPARYKDIIIENRNLAAFNRAEKVNTIEAYNEFLNLYPGASQYSEIKKRRNSLVFDKVKSTDSIATYKAFIKNFPDAEEVPEAKIQIIRLSFDDAQKKNTSGAYKQFMDTYPQSSEYSIALERFERLQFIENTQIGKWKTYESFIKNYKNNSWINAALDSIFRIGKVQENLDALRYCAICFTGEKRKSLLLLLHDLYTNDGEWKTLNLFYSQFDNEIFNEIKPNDYEIAGIGLKIDTNIPYYPKKTDDYDKYIKLAAPKERAFVALQRMIASDIANRKWESAIKIIKKYSSYFGSGNKKIKNLVTLLKSEYDTSIKINSVGNSVNTSDGWEYNPVISADGKILCFCGRFRTDNIGGEDIYLSRNVNGIWSNPEVIKDLSFEDSNDAPENLSADGNTMLLFKSGKLFYSDKSVSGWTQPIKFSEKINSGRWQADAVLSSNGKALLFASTKEGGYNLYNENTPYHGDTQYPSDIYVSLLKDDGEWSEPINLGPVINTKYTDRSPFLHPDMHTLYFSSDGHGGLGKMDVFKSTRLSDTCWGCWSEPVNMGKEINTTESDWGYKITTDGNKAYFSRSSSSQKINEDIYWLNLPGKLKPGVVTTIAGKIMDQNGQPLSTTIHWEDLETGLEVGQSKSDPNDGSYFIVLPPGKIYGYYVDKDYYFPVSENVDLRNNDKPGQYSGDIVLYSIQQMVEKEIAVPINNLFFNFAESTLLPYSIPELKRVAKIIIKSNLKVEISGHTDAVGEDKDNLDLSERRAKAVKNFLIEQGCNADNLITRGYGESKPLETNETEQGRAKNRRVELKFVK